MTIDLKAIRAAAEAATPGPWFHGECKPADGHALAWLGNSFVDCGGGCRNYVDPARDAAYIATANPATVISLLDRLEAAEKDAARWKYVQGSIYKMSYDDHGCGPEFDLSDEAIDAAMEDEKK